MHYFIMGLILSVFVFVSTFLFEIEDGEDKIQMIFYRCLSFLIILIALLGIVLKF